MSTKSGAVDLIEWPRSCLCLKMQWWPTTWLQSHSIPQSYTTLLLWSWSAVARSLTYIKHYILLLKLKYAWRAAGKHRFVFERGNMYRYLYNVLLDEYSKWQVVEKAWDKNCKQLQLSSIYVLLNTFFCVVICKFMSTYESTSVFIVFIVRMHPKQYKITVSSSLDENVVDSIKIN